MRRYNVIVYSDHFTVVNKILNTQLTVLLVISCLTFGLLKIMQNIPVIIKTIEIPKPTFVVIRMSSNIQHIIQSAGATKNFPHWPVASLNNNIGYIKFICPFLLDLSTCSCKPRQAFSCGVVLYCQSTLDSCKAGPAIGTSNRLPPNGPASNSKIFTCLFADKRCANVLPAEPAPTKIRS